MLRTSVITLLFALMNMVSMQEAVAEKCCNEERTFKEFAEVTFNNYPDDTEIIVNDLVKITPTRKNITINGVKKVEVQHVDGFMIVLLLIQHLQNTKTITVTKNVETGEHTVNLN